MSKKLLDMRAKSSVATTSPRKRPANLKSLLILVKDKNGNDKIVRFGDPNMEHHSEGGKKGSGHGDAKSRG